MQNIFGSILGRKDRYCDTCVSGGNLKVGDIVYITSFADHKNPCRHSGCPTWRSAIGVITEVLYEYDGSQSRIIVLVEGEEHYFSNYNVRPIRSEDKLEAS